MNKQTTFSIHAGLNLFALLVLAFCFGGIRIVWRHSDMYPSLVAISFFLLLPVATLVTHRSGPRFSTFEGREKILFALSLGISWGLWIFGSAWITLFVVGIKTGLWGSSPD